MLEWTANDRETVIAIFPLAPREDVLDDPRRALADRIYYGWVIVAACLLASMVVFGTSYAFGVFFDALLEEFDRSQAVVSAIFGLQTALLYGGAVVAGRFVDRSGRRVVAAAGSVMLTVGVLWTALARSFLEVALAFGVLTAFGMAALFVIAYATVPLWFRRRRGMAAGIAAAGLGVGLVVIPPGSSLLIDALGWRLALVCVALVSAVVLVVVVVLLADRPEEVGAESDVSFADTTRASDSVSKPSLSEIVRSAPFLFMFAGWTLVFAPLYVVLSYAVLYTTDAGLGRSVGVFAITVVGITTTASRILIGVLSDRIGRTGTFVACAVLMGGSTTALVVTETAVAFLFVIACFGTGYGGCGGLLGPMVADVFGNQQLNSVFSIISLSFGVSGLLAPPAVGLVFASLGTYDPAFVAVGGAGVVGAGLVLVGARFPSTRGV